MTALRFRLWFWQLITRLSYFSQFFFFFNKIKNFFFLLWVNLYMMTDTYLHDPPHFKGSFFMTPPFPEIRKRCDPLSVSTPPPSPLLISDKSFNWWILGFQRVGKAGRALKRFSFQIRETLLFLSTNIAVMTSATKPTLVYVWIVQIQLWLWSRTLVKKKTS